MSNKITPIPKVPDEIKDAVNNGTLAVFIGAGVSRLVGCDGWDTLASNLVKRCHEKIISFNDREWETLSQNLDHKKTITSCYNIFKKNGQEDCFFDEMRKSLKEGENIKTPNIYDDIKKLRGLFITTNADTHFDYRFFNPPNIKYMESDFIADRLNSTNLYHIHGSIKDKPNLIFTVSKYMERYSKTPFKDFLKRIFGEYTVLFLGYGLAEFEILDFLLKDNEKMPKRFMLAPFCKGHENLLEYEQAYYNDLGIEILPYEKDENGYKRLIKIIKEWNKEIFQVTTFT